ncbi:MAG: hypothetical protein WKG01_20105 [Kofleriaceae bacterium]
MTVLALWIVPSTMAYLCLMDGQSRSECCCPQNTKTSEPSDSPIAKAASCCEVREVAVDEPPSMQVAPIFEMAPPVRATAMVVVQVAPVVDDASTPRAVGRGPPANAHDHLLAKSSLLI